MITNSIGFIGAGRITRIMLKGWQRAGLQLPEIIASDVNPDAVRRLPRLAQLRTVINDPALAARQDVVFLALHPPCIVEALEQVRGELKPTSIVVSLAPKLTIAKLTQLMGGFGRIARVIPNAPSIVGEGFNPMCFASELSSADRSVLSQLFEPLGAAPVVAEELLESHAVISAMGPTYLWPQLLELVSLSQSFGLSPEASVEAVCKMVSGAGATLEKADLANDELLDLVPVRPLGDFEATQRDAYRTRLPAIFEKIRP